MGRDIDIDIDIGGVQATYAATLVDEWIRLGVRHAVIAPGSRSTPMAVAIATRPELAAHVVHDERAAAFVALGLGLSGAPALLLCTSGTATANFYPAVVEANLSAVPMIVLTADRPAELRNVGAPQTIDQRELYGRHVRAAYDPGVPTAEGSPEWRAFAAEVWARAGCAPVQLNLQFVEPLLGDVADLPRPLEASPDPDRVTHDVTSVPDGLDQVRGVIVVGGRSGVDPGLVARLGEVSGWPLLADPTSQLRHLPNVVTTADTILRHDRFADDHLPASIVRVGRPPASRIANEWVQRATVGGAVLVQVGGPGRIDPGLDVTAQCAIDDVLAAVSRGAHGTPWTSRWRRAEERALAAIESELTAIGGLTEPAVARTVAAALPADAHLTVASSMPVRDLEWYAGAGARAHANRGANGIDGTLSTALGVALTGRSSFVLVGDLAFVHDANALVGVMERDVDVRIVVVDNDGGGIFSFLPQADRLGRDRFEQLFGTPLGADLVGLAAAFGVPARTVTDVGDLVKQFAIRGPWMLRVPTDRAHNVEVHRRVNAAVADALGPAR